MAKKFKQKRFDNTIGRLDRVLSELVNYGKGKSGVLDDENRQTLKHHAEDMVAAAQSIMKHIGLVDATPQPELTKEQTDAIFGDKENDGSK